jgi:hypothetical protein
VTIVPLLATALVGGAAAGNGGRAALPSTDEVAGLLLWDLGRPCRDLIDACVDENGRSAFDRVQFKVSELKCRRLPQRQAACSFVSQVEGAADTRERCAATFQQTGEVDPYVMWRFASKPWNGRRSLSPSPILTCKPTHQGS